MDWQLGNLNPVYMFMFRESKLEPEKRSADFAAQVKQLGAELSILDKRLAESPYLAGKDMSLADICLAPIVARCLRFGVELPPLEHLRKWDAAMGARDAFKRATAA